MMDFLGQASAAMQYAMQAGASVVRLGQAIAIFNYQLLGTVFRALAEGCKAVFTIGLVLGTACADIVVYLADFCSEVLQFLLQLLGLGGKLGVIIFEALCVGGSWFEQSAAYVASVLVHCLRGMTASLSQLHPYCAAAAQHVTHGAKWTYNSLQSVFLIIVQSVWLVLSSSVLQVVNATYYLCACVKHSILYMLSGLWTNLIFVCSSLSALVQVAITRLYDFRISIPAETLYVMLVIAILNVGLLVIVPLMRKQGLTFPVPWRHSLNHDDDRLDFGAYGYDDEIMISSESEVTDSDTEDRGSEDQEVEDDEEEDEEDLDLEEFEVATDSESESEGDENDPNAINIELPLMAGRYTLRGRPSPSPMPSCSKLSPHQLEETLENERDKRLCVVCQDQVKSVLVLPCKHMCLCIDCAHAIAAARRPRRICPLCRGPIHTVMNVFV